MADTCDILPRSSWISTLPPKTFISTGRPFRSWRYLWLCEEESSKRIRCPCSVSIGQSRAVRCMSRRERICFTSQGASIASLSSFPCSFPGTISSKPAHLISTSFATRIHHLSSNSPSEYLFPILPFGPAALRLQLSEE